MKRSLVILAVLIYSSGCSHVISQNIRDRVDTSVSLHAVFKNPDTFRGSVVIAGGTIVGTENRNDGSYIEVIEKPLNYRGVPKFSDSSYGRFIVMHSGFLDSAVFSRGKHITVAGEVIGSRTQKLDEMDYSYLFLKAIEIQLVRPDRGIPVHIGVGISHSF